MASKRPKAPRGTGIKRVVVEERDRPEPVRVTITKDNRPKMKKRGPMSELIQRGLAERSFI